VGKGRLNGKKGNGRKNWRKKESKSGKKGCREAGKKKKLTVGTAAFAKQWKGRNRKEKKGSGVHRAARKKVKSQVQKKSSTRQKDVPQRRRGVRR